MRFFSYPLKDASVDPKARQALKSPFKDSANTEFREDIKRWFVENRRKRLYGFMDRRACHRRPGCRSRNRRDERQRIDETAIIPGREESPAPRPIRLRPARRRRRTQREGVETKKSAQPPAEPLFPFRG